MLPETLGRGLGTDFSGQEQSLNADIMDQRLPVVQSAEVRDQALCFAKPGMVRLDLAAHGNTAFNQPEFGDFFARIVVAIQEGRINRKIWRLLR